MAQADRHCRRKRSEELGCDALLRVGVHLLWDGCPSGFRAGGRALTHSGRIVIQLSVGAPMRRHDYQSNWSEIFTEVQEHMTAWRREHPQATLAAIERETQRVLARLQARLVYDLA